MPLKLAEIPRNVAEVVRRFPLPVFACLIAYGCVLALIEDLTDPVQSQIARMLLSCILAVPLWFALAIRRPAAAGSARFLPELIGVSLVVSYSWWLQTLPVGFPFRHGVQFAFLLVAAHFFVACAPFLRGGNDAAFWNYNKTLFLRWLLGVLYAIVLFVGLALAMLSVDRLLSLDIDDKNYPRLFFAIVTVFHPLFFLAGAPREFPAASGFPTGLRRFVQFCFVPLVGLYVSILYLYTAKILITWELPNGWVALPVLILAIAGILSALLLEPLRGDSEHVWADLFTRWFYRLLLPLTILLMISIGVRLTDYGVTENRYIVATLAGWLFIVAAGYGWFGLRAARWIPLSLGTLCLLAAFGPWSASTVAARSQSARVMTAFAELGVLNNGVFVEHPQTIPNKTYDDLRSRIDYLFWMHGSWFFDVQMANFPGWNTKTREEHHRYYGRGMELLQQVGLRTENGQQSFYRHYNAVMPIAVTADAQLSLHEFHNRESQAVIADGSKLLLEWQSTDMFVLRQGDETQTLDWKPSLADLSAATGDTDIPADHLTRHVELGGHHITLTLLSVGFNRTASGKIIINYAKLLVLVRPST